MAILAIFNGGINKVQYQVLRLEVNWERDQPPGGMLHIASFDDQDRAFIVDVWDNREALEAFVEQRLMPAIRRLGYEPPDIQVHPVHNLKAYRATVRRAS